MAPSYTLPGRLPGLLKQIVGLYRRDGMSNLPSLIENARSALDLKTNYDNWNGGTTGHDIIFYLPLEALTAFSIDYRREVAEKLKTDINALITRSNEYIREVHLELADDSDPEYQAAKDYPTKSPPDPDSVEFWKPGLVRAFITHRDCHKGGAHRLADALEGYGISCFVAHDTVIPMKEWRKEIMTGLQTMEIMIVYLTDDFDESIWTNQEIGFALGAQKPVVCLKLGKRAPSGFVDHIQALPGNLNQPENSAPKLYKHLADALNASDRLNNGMIEAFAGSPNWGDTTLRFDRMTKAVTKLTDQQLARVIDGFNSNDQLYGAAYLANKSERMARWLSEITGKAYERHNGRLRLVPAEAKAAWDDIPF